MSGSSLTVSATDVNPQKCHQIGAVVEIFLLACSMVMGQTSLQVNCLWCYIAKKVTKRLSFKIYGGFVHILCLSF